MLSSVEEISSILECGCNIGRDITLSAVIRLSKKRAAMTLMN